MKLKENKGITLIMLVVTIIVILIIAGVSISGAITGADTANDNRAITDLEKVQHAITQRYAKFKLTKDTSLLVGTKIELSSLTNVPDSVDWKVFQFTTEDTISTYPERKYYRLSKSDLESLGLTSDYKGSSYIVNYYSGEAYDEGLKQTSNGNALYRSAISNEVSGYGDTIIQDGLQVWYDAENNTGSGHSSSTKTWFDLSGNNNHATLYNFATTPTEDSGWHSNYLAFDGENDFASKNDITIDGANGTIEVIARFISGSYIFRSNASGLRTYIRSYQTDKGNPVVGVIFNNSGYNNLASRVLKYYTENNSSKTLNYYNMNKSEEKKYQTTSNGNFISIGSFYYNEPTQLAKMQVYAVHVYNRALTEDEIHHNYILDKNRFGIEE